MKNHKQKVTRSDIPYVDRLLMQKYQQIADHRNDAARIALQVACVALNDTEGLGYLRLSRFAKRCQELIKEYYDDTEMGSAHLKTRLEQLGFIMKDGKMLVAEDSDGTIVPTKLLEVQNNRKDVEND